MNNTFNAKRFWWLLKKTILERPVQLFGLIGLALLLTGLIYSIFKNMAGFEDAQNISFVLGFVGGGSFLASFVFNYFSSNASGTSYLTLPASTFEKWLLAVGIAGILFPGLFLFFYRLIDMVMVSLYHSSLDPKDPYYKSKFEMVNEFPFSGFIATRAYILFLNLAGSMLIGSLYFNKASFIKVSLIICVLLIGGVFLNYFMATLVFAKVDRALPYNFVFIPVGKEFGKVILPQYASAAVDMGMIVVVPAILWLSTLLRLREKEF